MLPQHQMGAGTDWAGERGLSQWEVEDTLTPTCCRVKPGGTQQGSAAGFPSGEGGAGI